MKDHTVDLARSAAGVRDHAFAVASLRLAAVPLAVVSSVNADGPATSESLFLAVAAAALAYSVALWAWVRRGGQPGRAFGVADIAIVLAFVLAADPYADPAGRFPVLLLVAGWALTAGPLVVLARGLAIGTAISVLQLLLRGGELEPRILVSAAVLAVFGALAAAEVRRRDGRAAALAARADELLVEAGDLERRERERIAQLVHDDALQRLLAARQELELAAGGDATAMTRARTGLAEASAALRDLTRVVHDEILEAAGLETAVRRLAAAAATRANLRTVVEVDPDVCGDADALVLAAVRELVSNVERHAEASTLDVRVRREGDGVSIVVQDDGCGVTPVRLAAAEEDGHLGHAALRRQVEQLHGTFTIDAVPGGGTRVQVRFADVDLRARRALERALGHEREWNATLVAGFPDPFVVSTPELELVEVSDRFVALTGFSRAELLASPAGELPCWPPEDRAAILAFASALEDGLSHEVRLRIVRKNGQLLPVVATASVVVDPRGGRRLQLVTFKDLTDLDDATSGPPESRSRARRFALGGSSLT